VTRTAPIATEWAAIIISIVPRGVPSLSQEVRNRAYASAASESQGISFVFNRTAFIRKLKISEIKQYKGKFDYAIEPCLGFCDSNYFDINMFL